MSHCCSHREKLLILINRQTFDLPRLEVPAKWFASRFDQIKATAPSFMRPKYFSLVIHEAYKAARRAVVEQCSEFVSSGHSLTHNLALCSVQMYGLVKSASLDPGRAVPSLAAGLPHFAAGWARCWGRDVVSRPLNEREVKVANQCHSSSLFEVFSLLLVTIQLLGPIYYPSAALSNTA